VDDSGGNQRDPGDLERSLHPIFQATQAVIEGDYGKASATVRSLKRNRNVHPAISELAESVGLMSVKVEVRELMLERAMADLRAKHEDLEHTMRLRDEFAGLFSGSVALLCLYAMVISFLDSGLHMRTGPLDFSTQVLNLFLYVVLAGMIWMFLRKHHYPAATFGVTTANWRKSVIESLLCCVAVLPLLVALKVLLVRTSPEWAGRPVIEWTNWGPLHRIPLYIGVAVSQEIMGRGFTQTCIERLVTGRRRTAVAILLASAEFGAMHLHYSFLIGIMAFIGAVILGTLYARHRTIIGICICHYVIGQLIFGPLQLIG